jgi:hypothetical protein
MSEEKRAWLDEKGRNRDEHACPLCGNVHVPNPADAAAAPEAVTVTSTEQQEG